ncbi:hypothetical protein MTP99_008606 [Tenebrio molitor]|nr:hypothetical protein MTP99_008606 [Tenebrio molitor]CAH1367379.1 unnamed protein product [Tenebrio molitor]
MKIIAWFIWCFVALFARARAGGHGGHHHVKFIIPYHVKTIKHTHTIHKTIHHGHGGGGGGGGGGHHSHGGVPKGWDDWH